MVVKNGNIVLTGFVLLFGCQPPKQSDCGTVDDEATETPWYLDSDGDGYGDPSISEVACTAPSSYVANNGDCDDIDAAIYPSAPEQCGADHDCDGVFDEPESIDAATWHADVDGDDWGDDTDTITACSQPEGYISSAGAIHKAT